MRWLAICAVLAACGGGGGSSGPDAAGAVCGDGVVEGTETCDDGNAVDTDNCLSTCVFARCGDGVVEAGVEQCDDGNTDDHDGCTNACTAPRCGDGIVSQGEECDDGNAIDSDGCTNGCTTARCGDGIVEQGVEECDDGNTIDTDACVSCRAAFCGDGKVEAGVELCDDGNSDPSDGCQPNCTGSPCAGDGNQAQGASDPRDGHCYFAYTDTPQWSDAEAVCVSLGGHLASVDDALENGLIDKLLPLDDVWLGGTDAAEEGTWLWADGTPVDFTRWNAGEPNNSGGAENCMERYHTMTWNDTVCDSQLPFICETSP